jgi:hypothetical protein
MRSRPNALKLVVIGIALGAFSLLGVGCSDSRYMDSLHDHPYCVDRAQIPRFKMEGCMDASGKHSLNDCLLSRNVPPDKIDMLNECIESHRSNW